MALILKRLREIHPETFSEEDDYAVLSGAFHVGRVSRITGGPSDGSWTWAINGVHAGPAVMEKHGVAPDLEAAKAALAANWRRWLGQHSPSRSLPTSCRCWWRARTDGLTRKRPRGSRRGAQVGGRGTPKKAQSPPGARRSGCAGRLHERRRAAAEILLSPEPQRLAHPVHSVQKIN